jgi:hypothetical protein
MDKRSEGGDSVNSLTRYGRWWITDEEKDTLKNTKELDIPLIRQFQKTQNDWSYSIEPDSFSRKNQFHYYHKMINQDRFELQCNKDSWVDGLLNAYIANRLTESETRKYLVRYFDLTTKTINLHFEGLSINFSGSIDFIRRISKNYKLPHDLMVTILSCKDFQEFTTITIAKSVLEKDYIKKRNRKLTHYGLIRYDQKKQKYCPTAILTDHQFRLMEIMKSDLDKNQNENLEDFLKDRRVLIPHDSTDSSLI